jgi:hypothetical protein
MMVVNNVFRPFEIRGARFFTRLVCIEIPFGNVGPSQAALVKEVFGGEPEIISGITNAVHHDRKGCFIVTPEIAERSDSGAPSVVEVTGIILMDSTDMPSNLPHELELAKRELDDAITKLEERPNADPTTIKGLVSDLQARDANPDIPNTTANLTSRACARTEVFAMEFVGVYRCIARLIARFGESGVLISTSEILSDMPRFEKRKAKRLKWSHPTSSDVERLLCSYKSVGKVLRRACSDEKIQKAPLKVESLEEWTNARNTSAEIFQLIRRQWEVEHRVDFSIVEPKIWEYFLSNLVEDCLFT